MKFLTIVFGLLILSIGCDIINPITFGDVHPDCSLWASQGECKKNPRYMISSCTGSCWKEMRQSSDSCVSAARLGQCKDNIKFMLLDCSSVCGDQIFWNPFARSKLDIPNSFVEVVVENVDVGSDIFAQGQLLLRRLSHFFRGFTDPTSGLSRSSPSEYIFLTGISEALLNSIRRLKIGLEVHFKSISQATEATIEGESIPHNDDVNYLNGLVQEIQNLDEMLIKFTYDGMKTHNQEQRAQLISAFAAHLNLNIQALGELLALNITSTSTSHSIQSRLNSPGHYAPNIPKWLNNSNIQIPSLGFGTWKLSQETCSSVITSILKNGVLMIDSAEAYGNQACIGTAFGISGLNRNELFLIDKISSQTSLGRNNTLRLISSQMDQMNSGYIDLYLLHSSFAGANDVMLHETIEAIFELQLDGKIRHVGVSNFGESALDSFISRYGNRIGNVNQVKFDPFHQGYQLNPYEDVTIRPNTVLQGYSLLSGWPFVQSAMFDPQVVFLAKKYKMAPSQLLVQWAIRSNVSVIVSSNSPAHIELFLSVFKQELISNEDLDVITYLCLFTESLVNRLPKHLRERLV